MTTTDPDKPLAVSTSRELLCRVPQATATFWVIKVLTTGMGEAAADDMQHRIGLNLAGLICTFLLVGALVLQFRTGRYVAWVYWLAVTAVSLLGTLFADAIKNKLHITYVASTSVLIVLLVACFVAWYATEGTLSIHSITTWRREAFYWSVVMGTFALGTAVGDLLALLDLSRLTAAPDGQFGWFNAGLVFTVLMLAPAIAYRWFGLNAVVAFWLAYVMTRPVGASFADWFASSKAGGLGYGTLPVTIGSTLLIIAAVGYLAHTRHDAVREEATT